MTETPIDSDSAKPLSLSDDIRRHLCDSALDGMYVVVDGRLRYANPALESIFGYEPGGIVALDSVLCLIHPDDRNKLWDVLLRELAGGCPDPPIECRGIRKDGSIAHLRIGGSFVLVDGRPAVAGLVQDLTVLKKSEEHLSSMLRFERLLNELITRFHDAEPDSLSHEIDEAQRLICEALDCDVSTIYEPSQDPAASLCSTHIYRRHAGPPLVLPLRASIYFPWCERELKAGRTVQFETLDDLPAEAAVDRSSWQRHGIRSAVVFPLFGTSAQIIGSFSFGSMREGRRWPTEIVDRLRVITHVVAGAITSLGTHRQIRTKDLVFDASIAANAIASLDGRITQVNRAAARLWGYDGESAMVDLQVGSLVDSVVDGAALAETLIRRGQWDGEFVAKRRDGSTFVAYCMATALHDPSGEPIGFQASMIDMSDIKVATKRLEESRTMLSTIVNSTQDLIWAVDSDRLDLFFANEAMMQVLGRGVGSIGPEGIPIGQVFGDPNEAERWRAMYQRVLTDGPFSTEYDFDRDGTRLLLSFNALRRDGEVFGISVIGRDVTKLKSAEERAERKLRQVKALRSIDMAIAGSFDLRLELRLIVEQALKELSVDSASVLLLNPHTHRLTFSAGTGFHSRHVEKAQVTPEEILGGNDFLASPTTRRFVFDTAGNPRSELLRLEGFVEHFATPMIAKGQLLGILEAFGRTPIQADDEWIDVFEALAGQTAIAVDNARLFDDFQRSNRELAVAYDATIEGWSRALDLRDRETEGHTQRVSEMTERLARAIGIGEPEIVHIHRGALLHDIGKMGVPDSILLKEGPLTEEEWSVMRRHPELAFELLSPIAYLRQAIDIPYCHHEKWDGTGYPRGLKGEQIPLSARLFAIVDIWDALSSDRPYRNAWAMDTVLAYLASLRGTHFDPHLLDRCLPILASEPHDTRSRE